MGKSKEAHNHSWHVEEFYKASNILVAVAILSCECGEKTWEEMNFFEESEVL